MYNKFMGGVDLHDNGVANFRSNVSGKKWWWPLFVNNLDSPLVNYSWKLYNLVNENNKMPQLNFKSYVALRLLKTKNPVARPFQVELPNEVRQDPSGSVHFITRTEARRRCRVCHSQTIYACERCQVYLHADCFNQYHLTN